MNAAQQHTARPSTPLELLRQLHGWLNNTGFGDEHPWCAEILRTLSAHANQREVSEEVEQEVSQAMAMFDSVAHLTAALTEEMPEPKTQAFLDAVQACADKGHQHLASAAEHLNVRVSS